MVRSMAHCTGLKSRPRRPTCEVTPWGLFVQRGQGPAQHLASPLTSSMPPDGRCFRSRPENPLRGPSGAQLLGAPWLDLSGFRLLCLFFWRNLESQAGHFPDLSAALAASPSQQPAGPLHSAAARDQPGPAESRAHADRLLEPRLPGGPGGPLLFVRKESQRPRPRRPPRLAEDAPAASPLKDSGTWPRPSLPAARMY